MLRREYRIVAGLIAGLILGPAIGADDPKEKPKWDVNKPPGDSSTVNIDTRSGTWMSVDVSPDGSTVAFDLLGDIYTVPIGGGDARAINSGLAWAIQPRFSPDGKEIAFICDATGGDNVWIMNSDGSNPRQLTKEDFRLLNNPTWSPDGRFIAARKHFTTTRSLGTGEIWLYHTTGGKGVAVIERPDEKHQKELGEPIFSADGRFLYYSLDSTPGGTFQYAQDSNGQIFQINRFNLQTRKSESYVTGAGGAVRPTPSPDGRYLAFVRRIRAKSALFLKDLTSGEEWPLYTGLDQDVQEVWAVHGVYPNMDWTPDSKSIVFWAGGKIKRIDIGTRAVSDIAFRVSDTRTVYKVPRPRIDVAPDSFTTNMIRNAVLSPDGRRVVFESMGRLYTKTLPDGAPKELTRDAKDHFEFFPSFSRDGKQIVFVAWDDKSLGSIRTVRATGGKSKSVTKTPGHYREPGFSPDGKTIVFSRKGGGNLTAPEWSTERGIYTIATEGGRQKLVTADGSGPQFGASNTRLFVTRGSSSEQTLVSMDLNGEAVREHATGKYIRRFVVAPDEQHLAFRENYHVYALPMPPSGKALALTPKATEMPLTRASLDGGNYPGFTADGKRLYWSLGASFFTAGTEELFARDAEGAMAYKPSADAASMSRRVASDKPSSQLALLGAKIITMRGDDGGVIDDGVIITEGNRIRAVGSREAVTIPPGAIEVDVSGKTIIPGLIDAHAHGRQGEGVIPEQNWKNFATLALGVTTIHDPSNNATEIFAAKEMQAAGTVLAPRIFSTGDIVYGARSQHFADISSLDEARKHVRRLKAQGAMSIKNYNQPRREQRQQVTTAAREENMLVVSEGGSLFHMDLSMVADGNSAIEHNLPQSMLYDDVLQFWGQTDVAYTPTLVVTYNGLTAEHYWYQETDVWKHPVLSRHVPPHVLQPRSVRRTLAPIEDYAHITSAATAKQLADEGVKVSIGAHGQREGLASHWEMWGFAQGGMSAIEALRTATVSPATALGFIDDLGTLETGKLADMVILDADVSDDIYKTDQVNMVMLNGRLYDAMTLDEQHSGARKNEKFYWQ